MRKIEIVCDMHRVPFGSPNNLAGFLLALDENKHLAMDFWSLVARMSDASAAPGSGQSGEPASIALVSHISDGLTLNGRLLETIVEGVTGQSVADVIAAGSDPRHSVGDLASLLAGEDIHTPVEAPIVAPAPPPEGADARPVFRTFADAVAGARSDEIAPTEILPVPDAVEVEQIDEAPAVEPVPPIPVSASLEPPAGVIEPVASFLPPAVAKSAALVLPVVETKIAEPVPPPAEAKVIAPTLQPEDVRPASPVLAANEAKPVEAAPPIAEVEPPAPSVPIIFIKDIAPAQPPVGAAVIATPEAQVANVPQKVEVVTAPVVEKPVVIEKTAPPVEKIPVVDKPSDVGKAPLLMAEDKAPVRMPADERRLVLKPEPPADEPEFVRITNRDGETIRVPLQGYAESNPKRGKLVFALVLAALLVIAGGAYYLAQQSGIDPWQWVVATVDGMKRDNRKPVESTPSPTPAVPPESVDSGDVPAAPQQQTAPAKEAAKPPIVAPSESANRANNRFDPTTTPAGAGGAVEVSHAVMEANLITARAPVYPEAARRDRIQGRVVLQAIVLKDGSVGHLHVVAGDPVLRSAAMQAVAKWRYWPYLVNGEPVDVSTLITVNFSLNQANPNQPEP